MMTIIVQNCVSGEYLKPNEKWTQEAGEAKVFAGTFEAYEYCKKHDIPDSQILLKFGRDDLDITMPVSANCR